MSTTTTTTRVIASKPKIGSRPAPGGGGAVEPETPEKKRRRKPFLIVLVLVVLAAAGGAWWFLMGPGAASDETADGDAAQVEAAAPGRPDGEPGEVLTTEAISVNLAAGHYLRLGLGLELAADVDGDISPARALDAAIALFSGRTVDEVASAEGRAELKDVLVEQLWELYDGDVLDVYFTDFVTQ